MKFRARLFTVVLATLAIGCTIRDQERKYRVFFGATAQALVPGFRLPDGAQYGPAWALVEGPNWRTRDGSGQTKAEFWTSGEFNGDGTIDYAYILVEEATDALTLLAFVSTAEGYEVERLDAGFQWGIWLRTRQPGRYSVAVTQSDSPDSSHNESEVEVRNQAIDFFQFEGDTSSFVWNATTQSFDRFSVGD